MKVTGIEVTNIGGTKKVRTLDMAITLDAGITIKVSGATFKNFGAYSGHGIQVDDYTTQIEVIGRDFADAYKMVSFLGYEVRALENWVGTVANFNAVFNRYVHAAIKAA